MILNGTTPQARIRRSSLTVLGLASVVLLLPAFVRAEEPSAEKQLIEAKKALELQLNELRLQAKPANPEADKARDEARQLEAELRKKMDEVKDLERRVKEAQDKAKATLDSKPGAAPAKGTLYELVQGEKGTLILRPVAPGTPAHSQWKIQIAPNTEKPVAPGALKAPPTRPADADKRAMDLEKRLDDIMKELEQLRKELKTPRPTPKPEEEGQAAQLQRARTVVELRLRAEEAAERLNAVNKERTEALAAVDEAKLLLEKARSISVADSPALKQYEERLAEAQAHLARINRTRLQLAEQEELARAREAAEKKK